MGLLRLGGWRQSSAFRRTAVTSRRSARSGPRAPPDLHDPGSNRYHVAPMPAPDAYAALRNPVVRRFAFGRFGAVLGLQMLSVAVGWHLYERTGSAWALGLVGAVELAPVFLLLPVTGTVADRYSRRRVAALAHSVLALATLGPGGGHLARRPGRPDLRAARGGRRRPRVRDAVGGDHPAAAAHAAWSSPTPTPGSRPRSSSPR